MNKKFFILALTLSFCSLTASAASNLETATYGKDKIASSSNATGEKLENNIEKKNSNIMKKKSTEKEASSSDAVSFKEDVFLPLTETADYFDILSLEDDILERAQYLYEMGEINYPINAGDIDYDKAVKIFMDGENSVTELSELNKSNLKKYLEDKEYIWELPINIGSQTISFTFNIGKPLDNNLLSILTKSEQEEINANEGHWIIARVSWNDKKVDDYKKYINKIFIDYELNTSEITSVLIGGIPNMYQPVVIVLMDDNSYVVPSCEAAAYSMTSLINNDPVISNRASSSINMLSYSKFRELINK